MLPSVLIYKKVAMTREEYERDLCARSVTASFVSVKYDAGFDGWEPEVGGCHGNVDYWVKHHVGHTAVRGWIAYMVSGKPRPLSPCSSTA
ncbi:hypothetical protein GCM10007920_34830 [Ciceribacter naphthalenivorans]|uniref:Uncharacterized protein n=2 Tax=Alphaproteobacteria TaxID=28211 RepID=A0ABQ6EFL0_9SPHN|nr:hypothetical protein GCM10007920_34830 [Ciceribacter naphthalenivorans]GLT06547.1 hypothetical protein GCM10007926_34830 [Sphingomonas psychrolutea]